MVNWDAKRTVPVLCTGALWAVAFLPSWADQPLPSATCATTTATAVPTMPTETSGYPTLNPSGPYMTLPISPINPTDNAVSPYPLPPSSSPTSPTSSPTLPTETPTTATAYPPPPSCPPSASTTETETAPPTAPSTPPVTPNPIASHLAPTGNGDTQPLLFVFVLAASGSIVALVAAGLLRKRRG